MTASGSAAGFFLALLINLSAHVIEIKGVLSKESWVREEVQALSPPGPGDDNQLASPLDPCEHPSAVSAAFGNAVPVGAAELTAARLLSLAIFSVILAEGFPALLEAATVPTPSNSTDSCKRVDNHVSEDAPLAVAPDDGVELPAQETKGFTREKKSYMNTLLLDLNPNVRLLKTWLIQCIYSKIPEEGA
ncbi:hypothetical protein DV515_00007434 [Chloebia gouldiae]|uniref:Uncharacterized protein n=1 Tax=Chloebia gouldiae TaxID=44316 RepID=A0A3L8SJ17_CHLGU|nr:hypothetical protein DV515_00007434 [Chloebia gouldiae]